MPNGHASFTLLPWCLALILIGAAGFAFASDAAVHDRAFWQSIVIGGTGTDAVLKRSFSALELSIVAARDNAAPFLTEAEYRDLLDRALAYLGAERDVRGYHTNLFAQLEVLLTLQDSPAEPVASARDSLRRALKAWY